MPLNSYYEEQRQRNLKWIADFKQLVNEHRHERAPKVYVVARTHEGFMEWIKRQPGMQRICRNEYYGSNRKRYRYVRLGRNLEFLRGQRIFDYQILDSCYE